MVQEVDSLTLRLSVDYMFKINKVTAVKLSSYLTSEGYIYIIVSKLCHVLYVLQPLF